MADFVIFTKYLYLLENLIDFFKSFTYDSVDQSALISRLMLPFRHLIISCGRYNNYIRNDAMADFAVYHKFGPW